MNAGNFKVWVYFGAIDFPTDDPRRATTECDIQNSVGVNSQGGAFNCGGLNG